MARIAVNAVLLPVQYSTEYILFLSRLFKHITALYPIHQFIFFCEKEQTHHFNFSVNAEIYQAAFRKKSKLAFKYWYDIKIPALLRRYKADAFFSAGMATSSVAKTPQCIIISDPLFLHQPGLYTKAQWRSEDRQVRKAIKNGKKIITFSTATKNLLTNNYSISPGMLNSIVREKNATHLMPSDEIREKIKSAYTNGKEFFFYAESFYPNGNLINLLKAFSLFKKRQQSSFQLLIYRRKLNSDPSFAIQLETYKYKADIKIVDEQTETDPAIILAAAYAFIYPVFTDDLCFLITDALKLGIPVITSLNSGMEELLNNAALYANPADAPDIANHLMRIYKDEKLRDELITKGKMIVDNYYSTDKIAEQVWQSIESIFQNPAFK